MSLPRLSILIELAEGAMRVQVAQKRPVSVEELRHLADLLRYFAASANEMERRLAGELPAPIPEGTNVVSLAAFAGKLKATTNPKDPS